MRVDVVKDCVTFKSGYPTFGTGHLSVKTTPNVYDTVLSFKYTPDIYDTVLSSKYTPDIYDNVYIGYKPVDISKGKKLDYLA